jgi:protein-S-isoprenylcysteine O-methyltransferase Ste14
MNNLKALSDASPEVKHNLSRRVLQMLVFDLLIALILFVSAGTITWSYGWFYLAVMVLIQLTGAFFMPLDMLAERGAKKENTEKWDKVITGSIMVAFLGIYLMAGLDQRWGWSPQFASAWQLTGALLFIPGCLLEIWAMYSNHFFSTAVRLQFDRGHEVCSRGPYQFVRHPGYTGMMLYYLMTPFFLGSLWALIPAGVIAILFIIRTRLEDQTLQNRLPGYKEYAARVRYRLLPGVW